MYNIDINFLNDRGDRSEMGGSRVVTPGDYRPLWIGGGVGVGLLALAAGLFTLLNFQNSSLQAKQAELDGKLGALTSRLKQVDSLKQQTASITAETNAYASVFNQIYPWSAMFQEIRERTPEGVQIQSIVQAEAAPPPPPSPGTAPPPAAAPSPGAAPAANTATPAANANAPAPGGTPSPAPAPVVSTPTITVSGVAKSFSDVNDFVLVLQKSRFLKADQTKLLKAELTNSPVQIDLSKIKLQTGAVVNLPKVVSFQIQSSLTDVPAAQLIADLNSNGAVGLVNRIETLRTKGVIQP
jgi:type IV pilus assembly protein PilN